MLFCYFCLLNCCHLLFVYVSFADKQASDGKKTESKNQPIFDSAENISPEQYEQRCEYPIIYFSKNKTEYFTHEGRLSTCSIILMICDTLQTGCCDIYNCAGH